VLFDADYFNHPSAPRSSAWNGIHAAQEDHAHP
jgi:hypothetical protein